DAGAGNRHARRRRLAIRASAGREELEAEKSLALAGWTEEGGALTLHDAPDLRAAAPAGKPGAIVDPVALLEVARVAVGADEVAQGRAAGADRLAQRELDRGHQLRALFDRDLAGRLARIDARDEQAFARIDVADADD